MEPQLEGCGKMRSNERNSWPSMASMEPQLEGCGKQWLFVAKGRVFDPLQWSRNLRVAERTVRTCRRGCTGGFNGAAT